MTLLLALSNESYAFVLGDRRLMTNGKVCDDEANKVCVLFCDDARVVIAFTGLAAMGNFRTQDWLRDTLYKIGESKHTFDEILSAFQTKASKTFSSLPGPTQTIAFLISGFRYSAQPRNICYLLSNFDSKATKPVADDKLTLRELGESGSVIVEAAGYTRALTEKDYSSLRKMLTASNPAPRVLWKAVESVRRVAKNSKSNRMFGLQCNSGVVPGPPNTTVTGTYHSHRASFRAYGPDIVHAVTGCVSAATGTFLQAGTILAGPTIRQNDLCWCGSGKRFRTCHLKKFGSVYARIPGFRKPMYWTLAYTTKAQHSSGRAFIVQSGFEGDAGQSFTKQSRVVA